jgi:hypothetical protein
MLSRSVLASAPSRRRGQQPRALDVDGLLHQLVALAGGQLALEGGDFLLELLHMLQHA